MSGWKVFGVSCWRVITLLFLGMQPFLTTSLFFRVPPSSCMNQTSAITSFCGRLRWFAIVRSCEYCFRLINRAGLRTVLRVILSLHCSVCRALDGADAGGFTGAETTGSGAVVGIVTAVVVAVVLLSAAVYLLRGKIWCVNVFFTQFLVTRVFRPY